MKHGLLAVSLALLLSGCATGEPSAASARDGAVQAYRGWYMEHRGQASFQPCGQSWPWRVTESADLPAQARKFDLQPDTPIYVRVSGVQQGDTIAVISVEQFGSPIPVRDCAMTGVVIPDP